MNVGSIFRTCDSLGIDEIILCGITATPPNREILKSALGSTESVKWLYITEPIEIIKNLKAENYKIISVEQSSSSALLHNFTFNKTENIALIFGNEVNGVSKEVLLASDHIIELPQLGIKKSLNVSVCAGIVLWEVVRNTLLR